MSYNNSSMKSYEAFMQSLGKLESLEKITADLEREISDSILLIDEIKTKLQTHPNTYTGHNFEESQGELLFRFLKTPGPKLLLPDMVQTNNVEIDTIVASMKSYAETIRNKFDEKIRKTDFKKVHVDNLDLTSCARNLEQLSKSLAKIKMPSEAGEKNANLERKLGQLCNDVTLFTQMVDVTERLEENIQNDNNLPDHIMNPYNTILNKFLTDLNEVIYLLKNNN